MSTLMPIATCACAGANAKREQTTRERGQRQCANHQHVKTPANRPSRNSRDLNVIHALQSTRDGSPKLGRLGVVVYHALRELLLGGRFLLERKLAGSHLKHVADRNRAHEALGVGADCASAGEFRST